MLGQYLNLQIDVVALGLLESLLAGGLEGFGPRTEDGMWTLKVRGPQVMVKSLESAFLDKRHSINQ